MIKFKFSNIELLCSVYKYIDSNMYLLISGNEAIVVDPHVNEDLKVLLFNKNIRKITIILTHEHSDHISGVWWFMQTFECILICSADCAKIISNKKFTRPLLLLFILEENDSKNDTHLLDQFKQEYVWTTYKANLTYNDTMNYSWLEHNLTFYKTQGHSVGSSIIVLDNKFVFTGDTLMRNYPVITSFPHGDRVVYLEKTLPLLECTLSSDMIILPGHGKPFVLSEIMNGGKIHVELR